MRSGAGASWLKAVAAVVMCLAAAGCTGDLDPPLEQTLPSVSPSLTAEQAFARLPLDGTDQVPITWDLSGRKSADLLLGAQRGLAFLYWQWGSTDWTPIMPVGKIVHWGPYYEGRLSEFENVTDFQEPATGPLWVKLMGYDGEDVTFCTDRGHWRDDEDSPGARTNRAQLETFSMTQEKRDSSGYKAWVVLDYDPLDAEMRAKYQAACTKWAQHQP
ncbi:MAG TPA: hypothetical protein VN408_04255 [Actinoplanes sp.]|nr:hypothetical protein [Actinoplanes sp.]